VTATQFESGDGVGSVAQASSGRPTALEGDRAGRRADDLAAAAVRIVRSLPRPVRQPELAGFLSVCRAHPQADAAIDYAARKQEQAGHAEQRVEHQFWGEVHARLAELRPDPEVANDRAEREAGRLITAFATHLVAENLLRLVQEEDAHRANAPRRPANPRSGPATRTGGERG
jgi:hypothetical protein